MFSLEDMIDVLIVHAQKQLLLADLLREIRGYNPRQYERYAPQLASPHVLELLNLGPELRSLEKQGTITQDGDIEGGWRVRPQVLLWWLADELACVAHSQQMFESWLADQVLERPLTWAEQQQVGVLLGSLEGLLRDGVASLIESAATIASQ